MENLNEKSAVKTTYFSIGSNFLLALIKVGSGILGNSYALIVEKKFAEEKKEVRFREKQNLNNDL